MHRDGGNRFGNAGAQRDDTGDVRRLRRLRDAAEDDFIHESRIEARARQQRVNGHTAQFIRRAVGEVGARLGERRADAVHDDHSLRVHIAWAFPFWGGAAPLVLGR